MSGRDRGREALPGVLRESDPLRSDGGSSGDNGQMTLFEPSQAAEPTRPTIGSVGDSWRWVKPRALGSGKAYGTGPTTGDLLRRRREELGWTQADFALRLGAGQPLVSRVEAGAIVLTLDDLSDWARVLEADLISLMGDDAGSRGRRERRPRSRSLLVSTRFARSVPTVSVDHAAQVGVSVRRLILAQQSRQPLFVRDAKALLRAGLADAGSLVQPGNRDGRAAQLGCDPSCGEPSQRQDAA